MEWRKSSYSSETADCVEIAYRVTRPTVAIRDSKRPGTGHLVVPRDAFLGLCQGFGRSK